MRHQLIIAIDGYSSCGKSTLARDLAKELSYAYVDTGAMYRAVSLYFINNHTDAHDPEQVVSALDQINIRFQVNPENGLSEVYLNGINVEKEIRLMPVANSVSRVSAIKEVRRRMVALQKEMGQSKGIVMDGRDIGTTVFPEADIKLFMTADAEIRVQRRYSELQSKGISLSLEEVRENIRERDHQDTTRVESPLTMAQDSVILDNTHLDPKQQLSFVMRLVDKKLNAVANLRA